MTGRYYLNKEITLGRKYYPIIPDIVDWCKIQYGYPRTGRWDYSEIFGHTTFYFRLDKDYNWFVLKWVEHDAL